MADDNHINVAARLKACGRDLAKASRNLTSAFKQFEAAMCEIATMPVLWAAMTPIERAAWTLRPHPVGPSGTSAETTARLI